VFAYLCLVEIAKRKLLSSFLHRAYTPSTELPVADADAAAA